MRRLLVATTIGIVAALTNASASFADSTRASAILTPDVAKQVIGADATASPTAGQADIVKDKTWVSKAHYTNKAKSDLKLVIRHAESPAAAHKIFESSKASFKGDVVAGIGESAFRTKTPAQLNVLKGANWLIITCEQGGKVDQGGQEKAAKAILPKVQ